MSEIVLFVFEGAKTERLIVDSLKKHFLNENTVIYATFNTDIYRLYHEIKAYEDDNVDIVEVLRAREGNAESLAGISRRNVAEVFLFFDYDGHATRAADDKIAELLAHFNEETQHGKLYISYPMVEAIKHLKSDVPFENVCVAAKTNIKYKALVSQSCDPHYIQFAKLGAEHWKTVISEHCKKMQHLMDGRFALPTRYVTQNEIFEQQLDKHIRSKGEVAVLSAFPLLVADYYGVEELAKLLES